MWELPFSTWIIDRSNFIHKGGNLISWLFNEQSLVSLGSAECGWWRVPTLKWMREHRQKTLWTYRCHISTAVACLQCGMFFYFYFLQGRLVKSPTISFLSELTARSCLFISMLCESKYGWAEVGFWQVARSRGSEERVSGTCLELLSAGKVAFWVIQRLCMSHSLIITLSSNQQVLQTTGCATLLALSCKYDFSQELSLTFWVIKC